MFDQLIESNPKARIGGKFGGGTTLSIAMHSVLIYIAVQATIGSGSQDSATSLDTTMVFIQQEEEKKQEQPEVKLEEVKGFTALLAPVNIPTNIPPINLNEKWDPSQFSGVGIEKGISNLTTDVKVDPGAAFIEALVDEKPALMSQVQLDYPDLLRQAGIEGTVLVEVIIDTTGHAEPASMRIVQSSNRAFELSARDAVLKSLYRPGRVRGQAVRVLVQVPINFSIRR
ncbi:MAG: energy transducer TonB [Gemmatimonadetes bacterium]|nr:energy transducer TonB [Gemmatimonadota bacterium]